MANINTVKDRFYTAGEIAELSGVSARTIRFYDSRGLLKPAGYSEKGYRLYDKDSFAVLQRILMFKYLGFSLEQISKMRGEEENRKQEGMKKHLWEQKELLMLKRKKLEHLIEAVDFALECREDDWSSILRLLSLLTEEEKISDQYRTDENLNRRIRIHSYNTNPQNWMDWVFERLNLKENEKVLEIGCGNGLLWEQNVHRLPFGISLLLTDYSEGMLAHTKKAFDAHREELQKKRIIVRFAVADANNLIITESGFDKVIANHMLYHVENRPACLKVIKNLLRPGGILFCSTVGENHMKELHELVEQFDERIEIPLKMITARFSLQNGAEQLQRLFSHVDREEYMSNLLVDDEDVIYDYVYSYPGNAPLILDKRGDELRKLIQHYIARDGAMLIHKETGMFICRKKCCNEEVMPLTSETGRWKNGKW